MTDSLSYKIADKGMYILQIYDTGEWSLILPEGGSIKGSWNNHDKIYTPKPHLGLDVDNWVAIEFWKVFK